MLNKTTKITLGTMIAVFAFALAPQASAQGFLGFSFSKHKKGKHFSIGFGIPLGRRAHVHSNACNQFVPGHFEFRSEQVWVPGGFRRQWVPAGPRRFRGPRGFRRGCHRGGFWRTVRTPGFYRTVNRRVWIPRHWEHVCGY